jgi:hypothetical protein
MSGMRSLNAASDSQSQFSGKRSGSSMLEIDSWMPSVIQAISPLVDRLMRLIEGSQCIPGAEPDVELALREGWTTQSCMAIRKIQREKYTSGAAADLATKYQSS